MALSHTHPPKRAKIGVLALGMMLACGGCYTLEQAAPPVASLVRPSDIRVASLSRGREIYLTSCATCHSPVPIRAYARTRWAERIIPNMVRITKLSADDATALRSYVFAVFDEQPESEQKEESQKPWKR